MAKLQCPQCGHLVSSPEGWAKSALATLMPAPAIQDWATQVRCPNCRAIFPLRRGGQAGDWSGLLPAAILLGVLLALALFLPGR